MFGKSPQTNLPPGPTKLSGMDMMIQSLLRNMGVSPDALTNYIEQGKQLATQFVAAMQTTANRLTAIEVEQKRQSEAIAEITSRLVKERDSYASR